MKFEGLSEGEGPDTRKVVDTLPLAGPNPVRDQLAPGVIKRGEKKLDHIKGVKTNKITLLTKTFHEGCLIYLLQSQKKPIRLTLYYPIVHSKLRKDGNLGVLLPSTSQPLNWSQKAVGFFMPQKYSIHLFTILSRLKNNQILADIN